MEFVSLRQLREAVSTNEGHSRRFQYYYTGGGSRECPQKAGSQRGELLTPSNHWKNGERPLRNRASLEINSRE